MVGQRKLIRDGDWDNLIILDACRFDYFTDEYPRFLDGELSKVVSPASCTIEWVKKTWTGMNDIVYVSGWPCANSAGIPRMGYRVLDHFREIIDVWKFGWDEALGTIPPWSINKAVLDLTDRTGLLIHYMQPHDPYIGKTKLHTSIGAPNVSKASMADPGRGGGFYRTSNFIARRSREMGTEYLKRAYRDNLRLVLKYVAELAPRLKGKTVVSADHGELLPLSGPVHLCDNNHPALRTVPWLVIK